MLWHWPVCALLSNQRHVLPLVFQGVGRSVTVVRVSDVPWVTRVVCQHRSNAWLSILTLSTCHVLIPIPLPGSPLYFARCLAGGWDLDPDNLGGTLLGSLSLACNLPLQRSQLSLSGTLSSSYFLLWHSFPIELRCGRPLQPFCIPACRPNINASENGTPPFLTFTSRDRQRHTHRRLSRQHQVTPNSDLQFLPTNQ